MGRNKNRPVTGLIKQTIVAVRQVRERQKQQQGEKKRGGRSADGYGWRGQIAMGHRGGIRGRGQINRSLPFSLERSRPGKSSALGGNSGS